MALANKGQLKQAERELADVRRMAAADGAMERPVGFTNVQHLLTLAAEMLAGEIEAKRGRHDQAIAHLDRALRMEDGLPYNEPPDWYLPVRHRLGAVLIEAGRPAEAEVLYWQDLRKRRENGFALLGMAQSLRAQGRAEAAEEFESRYHAAWADADAALTTSRF
jgi:tetratricopeptide (TPR) repeat protein